MALGRGAKNVVYRRMGSKLSKRYKAKKKGGKKGAHKMPGGYTMSDRDMM